MHILSALDAISPSIARSRLVLFSPFRRGRTWKLSATAYLSAGSTLFLPFPLIQLAFIPVLRQLGVPWVVPIMVTVVAVAMLIYLVLFVVFSRLRFASFDIVLNCGQFVAPAWRKYGPQSFKWALFKIVLGCLVAAAVAAPAVTYIHHMITAFTGLNLTPGQQLPPQFIASIFAGYAAFALLYLCFGLYFWASSLLSDFVVPSLALEDTTLGEAFRRLGVLIRSEPGQFTLYAVLKLGLALTGYMAMTIGFYIVLLVVGLVFGLVVFVGYVIVHALGASAIVLTVLGGFCGVVGIILYLFLVFYVMWLGIGAVLTFLEAYPLYFLAGRYPLLGELLAAPTPLPAAVLPPDTPAFSAPPSQ